MSGYTDNSIDPSISRSGAFLPKPFTLEQLLGAVRSALEPETLEDLVAS